MIKEIDGMMTNSAMLKGLLFGAVLCLLAGTGPVAAEEEGGKAPAVKSAPTRTAEKTDEDRREEWQKRVRDARKQLDDAAARKAQLEQKRDKLKYEWAGPDAKRTNEMIDAELNQTAAELLKVQLEIDKATDLIENVIPDEARKAGVPPGWVR
jgi:septal ring factor EnvC (AmiA/AmiB activator)